MRDRRFLILVESPTKAKTLRGFLERNYEIEATRGHVRDLPLRELGVDLESFSPRWVFLKGKRKLLERISSKEAVFLIATDPDREGERIAFDIWDFLRRKGLKAWRVEFHEITPSAVKRALSSPGEIDFMRVKSAVSRRVLDRLYGYLVSPVLWKRLGGRGLSAGRVQSCALKMIVERERERENFVPEKWNELTVFLRRGEVFFEARLWNIKEDIPERLSEKDARSLEARLKGGKLKLLKLEHKDVRMPPPPPFKTATLLQKASSLLRLSSSRAMKEAQELFERGFITYHRTDSCFLSEEAIGMASSFISDKFGKDYLRVRKYPKTGAHEAIRPTNLSVRGVSPLYDLIWSFFIASQMSDVELRKERAIFSFEDKLFLATGESLLFDGWSAVLRKKEIPPLPPLSENEEIEISDIRVLKKKSQPPPRYTEASLIKELERKGVGRPSTYATIISTLLKRGYVARRKRALLPTDLGFKVCGLLEEVLGDEMLSPEFTSEMEKTLDRVERGEIEPEDFLKGFYKSLTSKIVS